MPHACRTLHSHNRTERKKSHEPASHGRSRFLNRLQVDNFGASCELGSLQLEALSTFELFLKKRVLKSVSSLKLAHFSLNLSDKIKNRKTEIQFF
jgi:hypothetical protein